MVSLPFLAPGAGLDSVLPSCTPTKGTTIHGAAVLAEIVVSSLALREGESNPRTALGDTAGSLNGPMLGATSSADFGFAMNAGLIFIWPSLASLAL
jgi:hypothetical protein